LFFLEGYRFIYTTKRGKEVEKYTNEKAGKKILNNSNARQSESSSLSKGSSSNSGIGKRNKAAIPVS